MTDWNHESYSMPQRYMLGIDPHHAVLQNPEWHRTAESPDYRYAALERPRPTDRFPDVGYVRRMRHILRADHEPSHEFVGPKVVGIMGRKRAGKDTFATALVEDFGYTRVAFADPLKEALLALNPTVFLHGASVRLATFVEVCGWEHAKSHPEVRRLLQEFGSAIRKIQPDFWLRAAMNRIRTIDGPVVVTDVRYLNEASLLRGMNAPLIRVVRPSLDTGSDATDTHPSETELDTYRADWEVVNDGSIADLRRKALEVPERFGKRAN